MRGRGLKWLGEAQSQGGPRVVDVYDWGKDYLDIERVNACGPTIQAARDFGVALAHMHDAGAEHFGSAQLDTTAPAISGRCRIRPDGYRCLG